MASDDAQDWEKDILAHIAPTANKRKQITMDSDEDEGIVSEDEEYKEIKSWSKQLIGNSEDRNKLMKMSELEREMILAERKKKVDLYQQRKLLKQRVEAISKPAAPLTDRQKKEQSLDLLRKRREKISKKSVSQRDLDSDVEYEDQYEEEEDDFVVEEDDVDEKATHEDLLKIQIKRNDIEKWCWRPMFEKAIRGCFVRVSLGPDSKTKEVVYRCCEVLDIEQYKRPYKVNQTLINTGMNVGHGKSSKFFLFDMVSNQNFTEKEWKWLESSHERDSMKHPLTKKQVQKKLKDLEMIRNHIFTEKELSEMIRKKKELQFAGNSKLEIVRLDTEIQAARHEGDMDKADEIERKKETLELMSQSNKNAKKIDLIDQLNQRNKDRNFAEVRVNHKLALLEKRKQGVDENDPFARRKTAPSHIIATYFLLILAVKCSQIPKNLLSH